MSMALGDKLGNMQQYMKNLSKKMKIIEKKSFFLKSHIIRDKEFLSRDYHYTYITESRRTNLKDGSIEVGQSVYG